MKMGRLRLIICSICLLSWVPTPLASSSSHPVCPAASHSRPFSSLHALTSQCPPSFLPNSPLHVNGNLLERVLSSKARNSYAAVLFYASWCPFSQRAYMTFEVLSSMYPHIEHLAVEQSSATPSLFSRFGIHSLPAIVMVKQKSRTRFYGSKDLDSLVEFYKQTTGSEPVQYVAANQSGSSVTSPKLIVQSWMGSSNREMVTREPYLIFSVLFLILRVLVYVMPTVLYRLEDVWASYRPHLNMEIFGETSQVLGRILQMIDVKRAWSKLRICKNRNFHQSARNARVWASSLASVSLGETSMLQEIWAKKG
ncbi:5'-adenylylsulfate reductase-like 5 [Coffea arabica]|uniref:5'-adenylylsulfate reductase-like 5 n=1 Tax=Coffea arabica TaxID=13443 RepID=A0A6P6STK8_COFAR|nr:5'-adenylylsulfate reductase-like 5 [Coffea arabica]